MIIKYKSIREKRYLPIYDFILSVKIFSFIKNLKKNVSTRH